MTACEMSDNEFGQFVFIEEYTKELFSKYISGEFLKRFVNENPILYHAVKGTHKQESTGQKKDLFKKCSSKK
jgi:hypothetical protein